MCEQVLLNIKHIIMKKLLIMAMLLLGIVAQAQERETVYVTFTSKVSGETEGVVKSYSKQK